MLVLLRLLEAMSCIVFVSCLFGDFRFVGLSIVCVLISVLWSFAGLCVDGVSMRG